MMQSLLPNTLRVLSYNIRHCCPPAKPNVIDVDAIAEVIRAQEPDLVALQEVDVKTRRSNNFDQALLLAQKTEMHVFFAKAIDFSGGEYGVAILSRFPILESQTYALPSSPSTQAEARVLATARIRTPWDTELIFASTHLDSTDEETNRLLQIEAIRKIITNFSLPTILGGDFNATPGCRTLTALDTFLQRTDDNSEPTFPAHQPLKTIDFIAYKPPTTISVVSHTVVAEPYASDHLPILSVLQFNAS